MRGTCRAPVFRVQFYFTEPSMKRSRLSVRLLALLGSLSLWTLVSGAAAQTQTFWLDEMDLSLTHCAWRTAQAKTSVGGEPLTIAGQTWERGVGTHAPAEISVHNPAQVGIFCAKVGVSDETGSSGPLEFQIFTDEKLVWKSGEMSKGTPPKEVRISLDGVKALRIAVDKGEVYYGDHANLADARIEWPADTRVPESETFKTPRIFRMAKHLKDESGKEFTRMDENASEWYATRELLQTGMSDEVKSQALHPASTIFPTDRDPLDVAVRRIFPLVDALTAMPNGPKLTEERKELEALDAQAKAVPAEDLTARKAIFAQVTALRRKIMLQNPLLDFSDLIFLKRHYLNGSVPEIYGSHMCDQYFGFHQLPGGGLYVLKNAFTDKPEVVPVLTDPVKNGRLAGRMLDKTWGFLSPELSHDGTQILFAAADTHAGERHKYEWTQENCFHIFKADFDMKTGKASNITQLTDGAFNEFDPCFLPNGRIVFISERRLGYGRCHGRPVPTYTLHTMNADGSDITTISFHETNEWAPVVDHNGMVVYTRWDYVDRGANNAHHPWITTPDGRDPRALHGNYHKEQAPVPLFEGDIRPVPNSPKFTATACAHHGQTYGSLILVDPQVKDDDFMSCVRRITPDQGFPETEMGYGGDQPNRYATAHPLSEYFYICVYDPFAVWNAYYENNFGIYLLDAFGNRTLLYRDPEIACRDAFPLKKRPMEPVVPHRTLRGKPLAKGETFQPIDESALPKTANIGLVNVYDTKLPFPEGTKIERLRIVQVLPKPNPFGDVPRIGYGDQKNARRILGTVPVEEDGSAYFTVPVNVPVYFQALDEKGVAVQTMRSDTYVHEGEELICQGCHEDRHSAITAHPRVPQAMRRVPSAIQPDPEGSNPFNFVKLLQPIIDAKCVKCHEGSDDPRAIDLSRGPENAHFFTSYRNLKPYCFFYNHYLWTDARTYPGKFGSNASRLYQILTSDHHGLKLTKEELYRFTLWMDNNCDFYGAYEECSLQRQGKIVRPSLE